MRGGGRAMPSQLMRDALGSTNWPGEAGRVKIGSKRLLASTLQVVATLVATAGTVLYLLSDPDPTDPGLYLFFAAYAATCAVGAAAVAIRQRWGLSLMAGIGLMSVVYLPIDVTPTWRIGFALSAVVLGGAWLTRTEFAPLPQDPRRRRLHLALPLVVLGALLFIAGPVSYCHGGWGDHCHTRWARTHEH